MKHFSNRRSDDERPAHIAVRSKQVTSSAFLPYVLIGILFTILRIAVACATPMVPNMTQVNDDLLLVRYAQSLSNGEWLGIYDKMTLVKNPGYAFVLLLPGLFGIPYQALFIIFQALSALCFAAVAHEVLGGAPGALVAFLVLLFMPELFTFELFQRIYRMGIIIPFVISLFSAYIMLYLRRNHSPLEMLPWAAIAGCSLLALCIIKEDGIWVFPFVGVVSIILLAHWAFSRAAEAFDTASLIARLTILVIPVALLIAGTGVIRAQNYHEYGIATTCERTDSGFARLASNLLMVAGDNNNPNAWVSSDSLEQAIAVSPTLASIEPEIHAALDEWPNAANGDLIFWALRNAYAYAGGYADGASADAFWHTAAKELGDALDSGALPRKQGLQIAASLPPVTTSDVLPLVRTCAHNLRIVLFHKEANVWRSPGSGELDDQMAAAEFINGATAVDDEHGMSFVQQGALDINQTVLSLTRRFDMPICIVRILSAAVLLYIAFKKHYAPARDACLFALGLTLSMIVLLVGVSMQTSYLTEMADWSTYMYCAGIYPLAWMTTVLTVGVPINYVIGEISGRQADTTPLQSR